MDNAGPAQYRERLRVPVAWWLLAVPTVMVLGGEFYEVLNSPWPPVIIACLAVGCAALLYALGRAQLEIRDGTLTAGGDMLQLTAVNKVIALDERQSARMRGPKADPAAHLYSRPYLKQSVYLGIDDPRVPYWLIGTRHPAELAAAVASGCRGAEPPPDTGGCPPGSLTVVRSVRFSRLWYAITGRPPAQASRAIIVSLVPQNRKPDILFVLN